MKNIHLVKEFKNVYNIVSKHYVIKILMFTILYGDLKHLLPLSCPCSQYMFNGMMNSPFEMPL